MPEGQAPSTVNDGVRAIQGTLARWHKDNNGSLVSTGSVNVFALAANRTISAYYDGLTFTFEAATANTSTATMNVDAVGAQAIVWPDGTALRSGDIPAEAKVTIRYDLGNTRWLLCTVSAAAASETVHGMAELATQAETDAGTDDARIVTPLKLATAAPMPRGYLSGLTLSNDADATNDINVTAGAARNADNDGGLILASEQTKQIDASWATGDDAGGLSSSLTLTNDTWYHVILGLVSGTVEVGFDTSVTGATLVSDHSFSNTRRIGSVRRGTAANVAFLQQGDHFFWDSPPLDVSVTNQGTSAVPRTMTIPPGIKIVGIFALFGDHASSNPGIYVRSPDVSDLTPNITASPGVTLRVQGSGVEDTVQAMVLTDTSSQIETRSTLTSTILRIATIGYIDRRGRDD
jgi:hypothetical protein